MEATPLGIRILDWPRFSISRDPSTSQQVGLGPVRSEMDVQIVIHPASPRFLPNRRPPCMTEPERDRDDDTYDAVFSTSMAFFGGIITVALCYALKDVNTSGPTCGKLKMD